MKLGLLPRRPILSNAVWLLNRWPSFTWLRRAIYRALSKDITVMTVHSADCLPIAREAFPTLRSELMYFGINIDYFAITPPREPLGAEVIHVVAAGNDKTRDWDSLLAAFGGDERFKLTLVCAWLGEERTRSYKNVTLIHTSSMSDLREIYRQADVIAVPMHKNVFSGITVALEAAAMGKPILSTETGGVPTYFDRDQVLYAPPGDPAGLKEALVVTDEAFRLAAARRAQARFLERDYSTRGLIARYSRITRELIPTR
jgi:glycosyltransferase involved in cell wall biosynthesis